MVTLLLYLGSGDSDHEEDGGRRLLTVSDRVREGATCYPDRVEDPETGRTCISSLPAPPVSKRMCGIIILLSMRNGKNDCKEGEMTWLQVVNER